MPMLTQQIEGMDEIITRMEQSPQELKRVMQATMNASLLTIHEEIPPYPTRPNASGYKRTGTLGRSLGSSMEGGVIGKPDIYEVKNLGSEGRFGTKLSYAPYVIGPLQAWMHYMWWTLADVKAKAEGKIVSLWKTAAEKMAKFLEGR